MPQMAVAVGRAHLRANHVMARIAVLENVFGGIGLAKLGQPLPLSNLSKEATRGSPDTTST